ncbi:S41 family peptidase [Chitinophaga solisilvae]|uniref:S41 family peptidase n=1 Tax=Chitinophaga solisilvae TaxID=1233460 RepID=UPI00136BD08B|nr:S41 family peptidase [Chitinophaga solisilvae]
MKQIYLAGIMALTILYLSPLAAQEKKFTELTREEILGDFDLIVSILQKQHPNICKFTDSVTFRHQTDSLRKTITQHADFYTLLTNLPNYLVRDAHLSLRLSNDYNREVFAALQYFPLPVIIERGRIFVNIKGASIPFGSEITGINDVTVTDILKKLASHSASDGYISTGTDRMYDDFQFYYSLTAPGVTSYRVSYITPGSNDIRRNTLAAVSPATAFQTKYQRTLPLNLLQRAYNIYADYLEKDQTGLLTVNTFSLGETEAYKEFSTFFREVNKRKYKQVIIDIRSNGGGDPGISALLYSFLATQPFRNVYNYRTKTIDIAYPEYVVDNNNRRVSEEDIRNNRNFFYQRFDKDSSGFYKGNARLMEGLLENFPPDKDAFHGRVFILTGGGTVSAATYFASLVQQNKRGTIVGKETGSGEASTTASWFLHYLLPGTKSILTIPRTEVYFFNATRDNGHGVIPDQEIPLPAFVQYFQAGKDPELSYVLEKMQ